MSSPPCSKTAAQSSSVFVCVIVIVCELLVVLIVDFLLILAAVVFVRLAVFSLVLFDVVTGIVLLDILIVAVFGPGAY